MSTKKNSNLYEICQQYIDACDNGVPESIGARELQLILYCKNIYPDVLADCHDRLDGRFEPNGNTNLYVSVTEG